MYKELTIEKFRAIQKQTIELGSYITILSGWNATGKSTILGLLGNSSELKKDEGLTYNGKLFRAEFSELFKGSRTFDPVGSCKTELLWVEDNGQELKKKFSISWQKDRFRIIPRSKENSAKFKIPVIYLGLSRLYPVGELDDNDIHSENLEFASDNDRQWFYNEYNSIMLKQENINSISSIDVNSMHKNKSGINTDKYDWHTNSAGQDNLSQILLAILSFRNLKEKNPSQFKGGLLLIDELEATLHPNAQIHILELLIHEAKNIGIQIVFTTHSLTIIEKSCNIIKLSSRNKKSRDNLILYYFTFTNDAIEIIKNDNYEHIKNDLLLTADNTKKQKEKIIVYTEDKEARWFLRHILRKNKILSQIKMIDIKIGCQSLVDLMNCDPSFKNYIIVFDGDIDSRTENRIKNNKNNYIKLPSKEKDSPEEVVWKFIDPNNIYQNLYGKNNEYYNKAIKLNPIIKKEYYRNNKPKLSEGRNNREAYKEWFIDMRKDLDSTKVLDSWQKENSDLVCQFIKEFKKIYNKIAKQKNIKLL